MTHLWFVRLRIVLLAGQVAFGLLVIRLGFPSAWRRLESGDFRLQSYLHPIALYWLCARYHREILLDAQVSDPANIRFGHSADPFLRIVRRQQGDPPPPGFKERSLIRAAALLKWTGRLEDAKAIYSVLSKIEGLGAFGLSGLGDISLLMANWANELMPYRAASTWLDPVAYSPQSKVPLRISPNLSLSYGRAINYFRRAAMLGPYSLFRQDNLHRAWHDAKHARKEEAIVFPQLADVSSVVSNFRSSLATSLRDITAANADTLTQDLNSKFRRLTGAGVPDNPNRTPLGPHRCQENKIVVAELKTLSEICAALGVEYQLLMPEQAFEYRYRSVYEHSSVDRVVSLQLRPIGVGQLPNAIDLGFGFFLIDDKYLAIDSKHVTLEQAKIFCPWLWAYDGKHAIVEMSRGLSELECRQPTIPLVGHYNYYHWFIETVGNAIVLQSWSEWSRVTLATYQTLQRHQVELLDAVFGDRGYEQTLPDYPNQYRLRNAVIATRSSRDQYADPRAIRSLRDALEIDGCKKRGKRLYLCRETKSRGARASLANSAEVQEFLAKYGFTQVDASTMSVAQQRELFSDCEMIAAPGGAALSNILFCPADTKILVLAPITSTFETWGSLAAAIGCKLWLCLGKTIEIVPNPQFVWTEHAF